MTGATGIMTSVVAGINIFKASTNSSRVTAEQVIVFRKLIQALDDLDIEITRFSTEEEPLPTTLLTMSSFMSVLRAGFLLLL